MPPPKTEIARIVVVGAAGHGKTALAAALVNTRAAVALAMPSRVTTHIEYHSLRRRFVQFTLPSEGDLAASLFAMPPGDAAVVVVSLDAGMCEETLEHLYICRSAGIEQVVVFFNDADRMNDAELTRLVMDEAGRAVERCDLTLAATVTGSARSARDEATSPDARGAIDELVTALDELPLREPDTTAPLFMSLQQKLCTRDGTVIVGAVQQGTVSLGQDIEILGPNHRIATKMTRMEVAQESVDHAAVGDDLGALLLGVDLHELLECQVAAAPGMVDPCRQFEAVLHVLRSTVVNDDRYWCVIGTSSLSARVRAARSIADGTSGRVSLTLDRALPLHGDAPFVLRDESGTVAVGRRTRSRPRR